MSMHKIELTEVERVGLINHGLAVGTPSQLSDCFRLGMKWAQDSAPKSEWINVEDETPYFEDQIIMKNEHGGRFSGKGSVLIATNLSSEPTIGRRTRYTHWMLMPV